METIVISCLLNATPRFNEINLPSGVNYYHFWISVLAFIYSVPYIGHNQIRKHLRDATESVDSIGYGLFAAIKALSSSRNDLELIMIYFQTIV